MPGRTLRIARIAGIQFGISPWWLVVVVLFSWVLGDSYFPEHVPGIAPAAAYALGLASVLLLFASIVAHEFGHALVARRHGIEVDEIDLWLLGGVARMRGEAHAPGDELDYALAGPAVTALVGACFGAAALLLPSSSPAAIRALLEYQAYVNAAILAFNLLPAFPLDGGRVLRAVLWKRSGELGAATQKAADVGRAFGYLMIALGVLELILGGAMGLWFALLGFFIVSAARQEVVGTEIRTTFSGVSAAELMSSPVVAIPAESSIAQVADSYFALHPYNTFPVVDSQGAAVGLISAVLLESRRAETARTAGELADREPDLLVALDEDVAGVLERPAFARVGRAVVVDPEHRPVGLLSITDIEGALRAGRVRRRADGRRSPARVG
ncbi:MAG TPA: site-2 protease family protein [Solirubrobacteraceae bacterium]|nr:site-2 protease family protein [Solirubrobacteraceae bacterium]